MQRTRLVLGTVAIWMFTFGSGWASTSDSDPKSAQVRVASALHDAPYFYDKHVQVSVHDGAVLLTGFVASAWDLQQAIRIAKNAAGPVRVIDDLAIKEGGNR